MLGVAGIQPGLSHSQFKNLRSVLLDGRLVLNAAPQFQPSAADTFELVTYQTRQGTFSSHVAPPPPAGYNWTPDYGPNSLRFRLSASGTIGANSAAPGTADDLRTALAFDGTNDDAEIAHSDLQNAFPITIMAWVKTDRNLPQIDGIISKYAEHSRTGYSIVLHSGRVRAWYFRDSSRAV